MEQHSLKRIVSQIGLVAVAFIAAAGLQAMAFSEPTSAPTGGEVAAPINTSLDAQFKAGPLGVNISGAPNNALEVGGNLTVDGGRITGIAGGVGIGDVGTGWFSNTTSLAANLPSSGEFDVQTYGSTPYLRSGPNVGGPGVNGTSVLSLCLGGICHSTWPTSSSATFSCQSGKAVQSFNGSSPTCVPVGTSVSGANGTFTAVSGDCSTMVQTTTVGTVQNGIITSLVTSQKSLAGSCGQLGP